VWASVWEWVRARVGLSIGAGVGAVVLVIRVMTKFYIGVFERNVD
jgi:hypothetical protein